MRSGVWVCVRARPEPPLKFKPVTLRAFPRGERRGTSRNDRGAPHDPRAKITIQDRVLGRPARAPLSAAAHSRTERRAAALYNDLTVTPHAPRTVVPESPEQLRAVVSGYYLSRPRDPMRDPHTDDRAFVKSCTPELSSSRAHPSLQSVGQSRPSASSTSSSSDALAAPCSSRMRFITVAEGGRLPTRISQCCLRLPPLRVPPQ